MTLYAIEKIQILIKLIMGLIIESNLIRQQAIIYLTNKIILDLSQIIQMVVHLIFLSELIIITEEVSLNY
jgi:hypothetical protein